MINYSPRAAVALGFLKRRYNPVEFFVEDTGNHNMWLVLLRGILPDNVPLRSVNLLGGRNSVIAACKRDQANDGRKKLYIIDGDLDLVLGRAKPRLKHLYRINAYCVENILINKESIRRIGIVSRPNMTEADIDALTDFDAWLYDLCCRLKPLFQVYGATFLLDSSIPTISRPINSLFVQTSNGPVVSPAKTARRMRQVARLVCKSRGTGRFIDALEEIRRRTDSIPPQRWISGKDYLLPPLRLMLSRVLHFSGDLEQLKVHLAMGWQEHYEPYLARRVRQIVSS